MGSEPLLDALSADLDALLRKSVEGCCTDESWRGKFCEYHRGYRDGIDDAERWVRDHA